MTNGQQNSDTIPTQLNDIGNTVNTDESHFISKKHDLIISINKIWIHMFILCVLWIWIYCSDIMVFVHYLRDKMGRSLYLRNMFMCILGLG